MSIIIDDNELFGIATNGSPALPGVKKLVSSSTVTKTYPLVEESLNTGLVDGQVPEGYITDLENPITIDSSNFASSLVGASSGSFIITEDIGSAANPVSFSNFQNINNDNNNGNNFTGQIDGCGHTIYYTVNRAGNESNPYLFGGLFGCLLSGGVIKNLNIYVAFNFEWTRPEPDKHFWVSGILGRLNGGTLQNCSITLLDDCWFKFKAKRRTNNSNSAGDNKVQGLGIVAGQMMSGEINNVTVNLNGHSIYTENTYESGTSWVTRYYGCFRGCTGGFIGQIPGNASTINFNNISICGSSGSHIYAKGKYDRANSNERCYAGGIIGQAENSVTIDGLKIDLPSNTIYTTSCQDDRGYAGDIIGAVILDQNPTISLSNIYYKVNALAPSTDSRTYSTAYYNQHAKITDWTNASRINSLSSGIVKSYMYCNKEFGLVGSNVWIKAEDFVLSKANQIKGEFIKNLIIDSIPSSIDVSNYSAFDTFNGKNVLLLPKTAISSAIGAITCGYFAFLTNEAGSSANTYKLYYNNGSSIDYTLANVPNNGIGIYDIYKKETISNTDYFVIKNTDAGYYS